MDISTKEEEVRLIDCFRKICWASIDVKKSRGLVISAAKWDAFFEAAQDKLRERKEKAWLPWTLANQPGPAQDKLRAGKRRHDHDGHEANQPGPAQDKLRERKEKAAA